MSSLGGEVTDKTHQCDIILAEFYSINFIEIIVEESRRAVASSRSAGAFPFYLISNEFRC